VQGSNAFSRNQLIRVRSLFAVPCLALLSRSKTCKQRRATSSWSIQFPISSNAILARGRGQLQRTRALARSAAQSSGRFRRCRHLGVSREERTEGLYLAAFGTCERVFLAAGFCCIRSSSTSMPKSKLSELVKSPWTRRD